jgi:hypothetical protein
MGMYDTVLVNCPSCGEEAGFQSKSGECILDAFYLKDCPDDVLSNVNRHSPYDCDCGVSFEVDIKNKVAVIVEKGDKSNG